MPARPTRRNLLIGGGVGVGLVIAWTAWPRSYRGNLALGASEHAFGAWLKIGEDGHIVVAVPQAEHGQGVYTTIPQIVADELGADWRTVGVEAAPLNPLFANPLALDELFDGVFAAVPATVRTGWATRSALTLTGGSTSIRQWEEPCRAAGAGARALLCKAAAGRWGVAWDSCTVEAGFVVHGQQRLRFAELAAEAARETLPDPLPVGMQGAGKLVARSLPRLDTPAKVDGSAEFAGDIRLPGMVFAAIRQGPPGSRLQPLDHAVAKKIAGVVDVIELPGAVAVAANTNWAAQQALDALHPRFASEGPLATTESIETMLAAALAGPGHVIAARGDADRILAGTGLITADYRIAAALHAAIETPSAVASYRDGRLELWLATQAPGQAQAAVASATGIATRNIIVQAMLIGGSFGAALESDVAVQAALLAVKLARPVSLTWSRGEALRHDRPRPPVHAQLAARLAGNGAILAWRARIAAPATGRELARRIIPGAFTEAALALTSGDAYPVGGALPPYRLPAVAIAHHPAAIGIESGHLRGGAHGYTCFFTETFIDQLAHASGSEALSFRIGMLGSEPRLARCLSIAASLGGWSGGGAGSGQGIAAHRFRGSYVAVFAQAHRGADGRAIIERLVAAVDCGRQVNPDIVRQQIEGGLIFGLAHAIGGSGNVRDGLMEGHGIGALGLPTLATSPAITVELIRSDEAPGGVSELGVPAVAPAIANAIFTTTGKRLTSLPFGAIA